MEILKVVSTNNFSNNPWHVGSRCVDGGSVFTPRLSQQCFNFQHPGVKVAEKSQLQQSLHRVGFKRIATSNHLNFFLSDVPMIFPWFLGMYLWNLPITWEKFPQENPDLHQAQGASTDFFLHGLALTEEFFGLALFGRLTKTHSFAGWMNCNKVRIYHIILYMICILYNIYIYYIYTISQKGLPFWGGSSLSFKNVHLQEQR